MLFQEKQINKFTKSAFGIPYSTVCQSNENYREGGKIQEIYLS